MGTAVCKVCRKAFANKAFCHFLILIMYGSEVGKIPDSSVQGSYGIIVIALFMELIIIVLTQIDKRRRFPSSNVFIETGLKRKQHGDQVDFTRAKSGERNRAFTIEDNNLKSGNMATQGPTRTSVSSLSEAETYRKFAYLDEPAGSIGSAYSLHTQGTIVTTLNDASSIEVTV